MADGGWAGLAMIGVTILCAGAGLGFASWAREYDARLQAGALPDMCTLWRAAHRAYRRPFRRGRSGWGAVAAGGLAACLLTQQGWAGLAPLLLGLGLAVLAWLDGYSGLLPDALTLPLMAAGWWLGSLGLADALGASVAVWLGLAVFAGLYRRLRGRDGFGGGDVKCLAMLAGWLGWPAALTILWWASILGLLDWACRPGQRQGARPFGPYLAVAACPWILWPEAIATGMIRLGWM